MFLDTIDMYCERTDAGFLAEPLNAITNIAFMAAAAYLYLFYRDRYHRDRQALNLIILVGAIGFGSALFHTFANGFTMLMDIVPIVLFVFYYLWICLQRFLHWNRLKSLGGVFLLASGVGVMQLIPPPFNLNHSAAYLPCLAAMVFLGLRMRAMHHETAEMFFIAASWFAASLFFRIIDMALCDLTFVGTHFLWHVCNSVVLALLTKIIIEHPPFTLKNN